MRQPSNDRLLVKDFNVTTGKLARPHATVTCTIGDKEFHSEGEGVGPVDALILALRNGVGERFKFALVDYTVSIRGKGTDAVVWVEMVLEPQRLDAVGLRHVAGYYSCFAGRLSRMRSTDSVELPAAQARA